MPIQLSAGKLHFDFPDGSTKQVDYAHGTSSLVIAPVEHNATNIGDVDVVALEIELKKQNYLKRLFRNRPLYY